MGRSFQHGCEMKWSRTRDVDKILRRFSSITPYEEIWSLDLKLPIIGSRMKYPVNAGVYRDFLRLIASRAETAGNRWGEWVLWWWCCNACPDEKKLRLCDDSDDLINRSNNFFVVNYYLIFRGNWLDGRVQMFGSLYFSIECTLYESILIWIWDVCLTKMHLWCNWNPFLTGLEIGTSRNTG